MRLPFTVPESFPSLAMEGKAHTRRHITTGASAGLEQSHCYSPERIRYLDRVPGIPESVSLTQCLQAGGPPFRAVTFDPQPANGMRYIGLHRIRAASSAVRASNPHTLCNALSPRLTEALLGSYRELESRDGPVLESHCMRAEAPE